MMDVAEVKRWIATLDDDSNLAIDDGGLCLVELTADGEETGAYIEIGGTPTTEPDWRPDEL
jgi:hypothetical protein